jgi:hypothetical protein
MDFDALPRYPATGHTEAPDRAFGRRPDLGEAAVEGVATLLVVAAAGLVGAFLFLWWVLTARPIPGLHGLRLPDLVVLVVGTGGAVWLVVLALVRRTHPDLAADYADE